MSLIAKAILAPILTMSRKPPKGMSIMPTFVGKVASCWNQKTVKVGVTHSQYISKYKVCRSRTRFLHCHDPYEQYLIGDVVRIEAVKRPFSLQKHHKVIDLIRPVDKWTDPETGFVHTFHNQVIIDGIRQRLPTIPSKDRYPFRPIKKNQFKFRGPSTFAQREIWGDRVPTGLRHADKWINTPGPHKRYTRQRHVKRRPRVVLQKYIRHTGYKAGKSHARRCN